MNFKQQSIQILRIDEQSKKFYLTQEGHYFLQKIQGPLSIITIAGIYRSGKSYLINQFIKNKAGFQIGSSTKSVTQGLQVWSQPIPAIDEYGKHFNYILIDSQGIGSFEQQNRYDVKLLMLIFLISSTVVYNSLGSIDEASLDQLNVVLKLNECIQNIQQNKPKFVWILRDFSLQLIDEKGKQITSNQYLQKCLEEKISQNVEINKKNQIRKGIKNNLSSRSCYTLVRPTMKQENLANLANCELRKQFVEQIECLKQDIFSSKHKDIKMIDGNYLNGHLFTLLLQKYIQTINNNITPSVCQIWNSIEQITAQQIMQKSCNKLNKEINQIKLPLSKEQLKYKMNQIENRIYIELQNIIINNKSFRKYHKQFIRNAQKINLKIKNKNQKLLSIQIIKNIKKNIEKNIQFHSIQPTNITIIKNYIEYLQLPQKKSLQAYEYILQMIYDLLHISETKSKKIQKYNQEMKKFIEKINQQQKNNDLIIINLKRQYHKSLKTITILQDQQLQLQKKYILIKNQQQSYQLKIKNQIIENNKRCETNSLKLYQVNQRWKIKLEQANELIKQLRLQNNQQLQQLQRNKTKQLQQMMKNTKQIIFQEKIKNTWNKFDQERKYYQNELLRNKEELKQYKNRYQLLQKQYLEKQQENIVQKQQYLKKQKEFINQMNDLKKLHIQSKKTYYETFETFRQNDKIMKNIQNITDKRKINIKNQNTINLKNQINNIKNYYQKLLYQQKQNSIKNIQKLNQQIKQLNSNCILYKNKIQLFKKQINQEKYRYENLEKQLYKNQEKFISNLSTIQAAKQKQRSLYQESIVRLLENIDRKEYQSSTFSRIQ